MTNKEIDGVEVWKQLEDLAVPQLKLSVYERAVYSHLLRHSQIEGKRELRFSIPWLVRGTNLTIRAARRAVGSLIAKDALRLVERNGKGHLVEVRLPMEIRGMRASKIVAGAAVREAGVDNLEKMDFLATRALRLAIHGREGGHCFYCLRRLTPAGRCLDHVVPLVRGGSNSFRNLVSACGECNSQKGEQRAEDFLRWLYREGRLTANELTGRLRALRGLAAGKLRPQLLPLLVKERRNDLAPCEEHRKFR
jgi:5-methylcytosine-specific restriction endonuclease McrA